jgi:hypothetical protein
VFLKVHPINSVVAAKSFKMLKRVRHETAHLERVEIAEALARLARLRLQQTLVTPRLSRKEMRIRLFKQQPDSEFIALLKAKKNGV